MKYHELNDRAKERVRQLLEPDHGWWEEAYEQAKAEGATKGFRIDDISFSGFWSQGDGASWTGAVRLRDWVPDNPEDMETRIVRELVRNEEINLLANVYTRGHGVHEMTMQLDWNPEVCDEQQVLREGPLAGATIADLLVPFPRLLFDLEAAMLESARDFAREIYDQLEQEYEYETSDEYIAELCEANEYEFNEDGNWA